MLFSISSFSIFSNFFKTIKQYFVHDNILHAIFVIDNVFYVKSHLITNNIRSVLFLKVLIKVC